MLKVVLIDDEYYFRNSLRRAIAWEENGFTVVGDANNGKTAYALIKEKEPDIALVDINMPGYNGLELIELLVREGCGCKFILLTGYDEFKYAQRAIRLGVSEYVLKPVDFGMLLESLLDIKEELERQSRFQDKVCALERQNQRLLMESYLNDLVNCTLPVGSSMLYDEKFTAEALPPGELLGALVLEPILPRERLEELAEKLFHSREATAFIDRGGRLCLVAAAEDLEAAAGRALKAGEFSRAGLGEGYPPGQLSLSYNEACMAIRGGMVEDGKILRLRDVRASGRLTLPEESRMRIAKRVLEGDADGAQEEIDGVYAGLLSARACYDAITLHTLDLLSLLLSALNAHTTQPVSVLNLQRSLLEELAEKKGLEALRDWVKEVYRSGMQKVMEHREDCCEVTRQVESYVRENYMRAELNIRDIAQNLYMNYSYLCYCFKRDRGTTINDFITQVRMERAQALFKDAHTNITLVSESVGYENPGYFSKCFKKYVGLSPTEYLRLQGQGQRPWTRFAPEV